MTTNPTATRIPITPNPGYSVFRLDPPLDGHEIVATIETDGSNRHGLHAGIYPADPATGGHADLALAEHWGLSTPVDALRRAGYEIQWADDPDPEPAAIVVPERWAWTDRVAAVPSPAGQEQPSITARTADAVTGIQLLPAGAVPAGWTAGELNDPITALDIWTDPERPGRFWALNTVHGALLRLGSEVYANPDTETGQQRSLLAAVADGTVVAVVLPVVLEGWATVGLVERIEALIGCEITWETAPAPGAVA